MRKFPPYKYWIEVFRTFPVTWSSRNCVVREQTTGEFGQVKNSCQELVHALTQCCKTRDLEFGAKLHLIVKNSGFHTNLVVANTLVELYRKCRSMQLARKVFDAINTRSTITWTCLIMGYVENGEASNALISFMKMDCEPDAVTFIAVLKACTALAVEKNADKMLILDKGVAVYEKIKEYGFQDDVYVACTLVDFFSKCGCMRMARSVFDRMKVRNVALWNCLLMGYVENGESLVALDMFGRMGCEPDYVTCLALLKACASLGTEKKLEKSKLLEKGAAIHTTITQHGFDSNILVSNSLIDMYSKCGSMPLARKVFDRMAGKDVVSWNSLILGYVENGESSVGLSLFNAKECQPNHVTYIAALKACACLAGSERQKALEHGKIIHHQVKEQGLDSNVVLANSLLDMYCKCGDINLAREVFESMTRKSVVTWSSLILGYVDSGHSSLALELFTCMDVQPNHVTFVAVLKACGSLAALALGRRVHRTVCKLGLEEETVVANSLVNFYSSCGCMTGSQRTFDSLQSPDIVSWTALLAGYSALGDSAQVFRLVSRITEAGLKLNSITFVCVLAACSHAGMVEEGKRYFDSLERHGVSPNLEHYTCMVDMLGRAKKMEEAVGMLNSTSVNHDPVCVRTLLGARYHG